MTAPSVDPADARASDVGAGGPSAAANTLRAVPTGTVETAGARPRHAALDLGLSIAGLVFAWMTLFYPFGRDQGLYYYVGREWAVRGSIPYRDILDHKTPGIYILHAGCVLLFGEKLWGIRVAELVGIVLVGVVAAAVITPRGETPARGVRGFGVLAASILYFGFFDFRETAEGEIWVALFGIAACMAIRRAKSETRGALACGILCAASAMMKPSAIMFIMVALALLLRRVLESPSRRPQRLVRDLALFAAGAAIVTLPVLIYFAAHHALADMKDIVVGANRYYVIHEAGIGSIDDFVFFNRWFLQYTQPFAPVYVLLAAFAITAAAVNGDRASVERHVLASLLFLAAWGTVAMQGKFYLGHWSVIAAPGAVVLTALAADTIRWLDRRAAVAANRPRVSSEARGAAASIALLVFLYLNTADPLVHYLRVNARTFAWVTGQIPREGFLDLFSEHSVAGPAKDNEAVGVWIREHSEPNDYLAVRGMQPQIYATAQRRYPGRFFWTTFLVSPARAYKREEWLAEDRAALSKNPPRYVVTMLKTTGTDAAAWWTPFGYTQRVQFGDMIILERTPETATDQL